MEHSGLDWDCRTAAMQPVAGWQPDIARHRPIAAMIDVDTHTDKKRMQINGQKEREGEKTAEKRKPKNEN